MLMLEREREKEGGMEHEEESTGPEGKDPRGRLQFPYFLFLFPLGLSSLAFTRMIRGPPPGPKRVFLVGRTVR